MITVYTKFPTRPFFGSDGRTFLVPDMPKGFEDCGYDFDIRRHELALWSDRIVPGWTVKAIINEQGYAEKNRGESR